MIDLSAIKQQDKKKQLILANYTCVNNNPAYRICTNKNCVHPSLCCQDDQCTCNEVHSLCSQVRLKSMLEKLYAKRADTTQIMSKVTNLFDSIIDQVSEIYQQTQQKIKRYGLRHAEIKFLQHLQQNRTHSLKGKIVHEANQIAAIKYDGDFQQIQRCVDKLWNELGGIFWGMLYSTKDMYEIPTRVNRLNPDSGEQFFSDIVEQTKSILQALQRIEVQEKVENQSRDWGETRRPMDSKIVYAKKSEMKRQKIEKVEEYDITKQGYQDNQDKNEISQTTKSSQVKPLQPQPQKSQDQRQYKPIIPPVKVQQKKISQMKQNYSGKIDVSKILQKDDLKVRGIKVQRQQDDDQLMNLLRIPVVGKGHQSDDILKQSNKQQNPNQDTPDTPQTNTEEQNRRRAINEIFKKQQNDTYPFIHTEGRQVSSLKQQDQQSSDSLTNKPIVTEQGNESTKKGFSLFNFFKGKQPTQQERQIKQICQNLNDLFGIQVGKCKEFVQKFGYNKNGKLMSKEEIVDIALTHQSLS